MEKWFRTCLLLCLFGLLKEFRPSEPFLTDYLVGPWQNLTIDQVVQEVYPVWTYSYLALLVVVFLVTDYLRYKPVVVFEGISYVVAWCVLLWGHGIAAMQSVEFMYAAATATQVAYSTYIYAQVPSSRFQVVTGYTQAAYLSGRCLAGIVGQILIATSLCDYYSLNYISLTSVLCATVVALLLPSVAQSVYFHRRKAEVIEGVESAQTVLDSTRTIVDSSETDARSSWRLKTVYRLIFTDFVSAFSNPYLLKWSFWWAFATSGYLQVSNYIQPLWEVVDPSGTRYNGAVEALHTFLSSIAALGIGYATLNWSELGEPVLAIISLIEGVLLFVAAITEQLWVTYIMYICFNISYSILITIASSEVAKGLKQESYGLVFGVNAFLALLFQTILTLIVADKNGLALSPRDQFKVYGGYYFVLGGVFLCLTAFNVGRRLM